MLLMRRVESDLLHVLVRISVPVIIGAVFLRDRLINVLFIVIYLSFVAK